MKRAAPPDSPGSASENIDVNSMLLFYEVVNAGSINQAAVALKTPKATISRRLRRLEQHVGAVLLKRGSQKLSMTSSGETLFQHCEKLLAEAQGARAAVAEMPPPHSRPPRADSCSIQPRGLLTRAEISAINSAAWAGEASPRQATCPSGRLSTSLWR
jgi:DNA-binding transcriptional LysR family regulator